MVVQLLGIRSTTTTFQMYVVRLSYLTNYSPNAIKLNCFHIIWTMFDIPDQSFDVINYSITMFSFISFFLSLISEEQIDN